MPTDDSNPWDPGATSGDDAPPAPDDGGPSFRTPAGQTAASSGSESDTDQELEDEHEDEEEEEEEESEDRRRIIIIAAVAFVLIAVIGFALTRGGDDEAGDDGGDSPTDQAGEGAGGAITISGTRDSFDRADTEDGLGAMPGGAPWVVESGGWAIKGNQAAVTVSETNEEGQERRNIAYVGTGYADAQAQVRIAKIVPNAGIVFRYKNSCNYWMVYAVKTYAIWHVEKIVDCKRVGDTEGEPIFAKIKDAPVADGTLVGVVLTGSKIQIALDGKVVATYDDDTHEGAGKVGLTVAGKDSTGVRFDEFVAGGPGGKGIIAKGEGGGGGSTTTAGEGDAPDEAPPTTEG